MFLRFRIMIYYSIHLNNTAEAILYIYGQFYNFIYKPFLLFTCFYKHRVKCNVKEQIKVKG